ncbi:putative regulator of cell autolysis [Rheinheimera sp. A13L]|uniref:sensor histidine kinase n=1 Tax=Rheinheimera sp. A13L TaxID=506534 RepID=UPI0002124F63|nr:histidine kinase [Rheinheimera sp. A13L]EGM79816.1 putative regulator of cell autolysis [Rheinheimera sp. A13L]
MKQLKTFLLLLAFSYGLMLYLALLQTAPGQPLQFHADAPVWLSLQAVLSLWLSRKLDAVLWAKDATASLLQRYSQSFGLSLLIFVGLMTGLQLLIDITIGQALLLQQYLRVSLMYLLVHSLIAGADLLWQALKRQQQQQLELMQAQQHNQQYKLQLLQQQLDPHFLFNNLNVLSVLIHKSPDQAEQFLDHFADIYRYQLQQGSKTMVSLADELTFAQHYMALLAQRFPASFQLQITIEPQQQTNYQLVPCCLQLLLENAVKHNSASAEQPLVIQIELQHNQLIVRHPLRPKTFAQPGTGIGLTNLSERCLALFGKPIAVLQNDEFIVKVPLQHSV